MFPCQFRKDERRTYDLNWISVGSFRASTATHLLALAIANDRSSTIFTLGPSEPRPMPSQSADVQM